MSSYTSSSDFSAARSYRAYVFVVFSVLVAGFLFIEFTIRNTEHDSIQSYLLRIMNETSPNVQIGDSHAGGRHRAIPGYAFIGRGSLTPTEMEAILRYHFRDLEPGKIMLVVGPNSFGRDRQTGWSALPEGTFRLQRLPFPILLLEPAFRSGLSQRFKSLLSIDVLAEELTWREAVDLWRETREKHGDDFHIGHISNEAEYLLTEGRFTIQNPVPEFRQSSAFIAFERLVAWLDDISADTCLVDTPLTPMYREIIAAQGEESRFDEAKAAIAEIAKRHGFRFASGDILASEWSEEMFSNQDHLNARGHARWWPMVDEYCFN